MITDFETDHFRFYLPQRAWDMLSLRLNRVIIVESSAFMPSLATKPRTLGKDKTDIKSTGDCNFEPREITLGHKHEHEDILD